ncbi:MAG: CAP domain-containing protein, partial [Bacillus sp. (in: firmicutes)]
EESTPEVTPPAENATPEVDNPTTEQEKPSTSYEVSAFEQKVVELTNAERAKQGLKPLTLDVELSKVARIKSQDMKDKNYFDHNSPTYGSPFDMMKQFGISYKSAGENIAQGQQSPEAVVQAWMNSQGHRENIMNASYTHIGIGHVADNNYWTQMFIGK